MLQGAGKLIGVTKKLLLIALVGIGAIRAGAQVTQEALPAGVEQIIPRGRIAAILEPRFVAAEQAKIADDAWILGVTIEGQAKAYSLNLLNRHEVVNDQSGETAFAAVW